MEDACASQVNSARFRVELRENRQGVETQCDTILGTFPSLPLSEKQFNADTNKIAVRRWALPKDELMKACFSHMQKSLFFNVGIFGKLFPFSPKKCFFKKSFLNVFYIPQDFNITKYETNRMFPRGVVHPNDRIVFC